MQRAAPPMDFAVRICIVNS